MSDILEIQKTKNKREKTIEKEGKELFRVVINPEANMVLENVLKKVNEGFEAGTVTKSDIANFIFQNIDKYFSENDIRNLRTQHFDDKKVLSNILKNENDLPEELKKAIRIFYGVDKDKKRPTKPVENKKLETVNLEMQKAGEKES